MNWNFGKFKYACSDASDGCRWIATCSDTDHDLIGMITVSQIDEGLSRFAPSQVSDDANLGSSKLPALRGAVEDVPQSVEGRPT